MKNKDRIEELEARVMELELLVEFLMEDELEDEEVPFESEDEENEGLGK
jgi:hypothetical protein